MFFNTYQLLLGEWEFQEGFLLMDYIENTRKCRAELEERVPDVAARAVCQSGPPGGAWVGGPPAGPWNWVFSQRVNPFCPRLPQGLQDGEGAKGALESGWGIGTGSPPPTPDAVLLAPTAVPVLPPEPARVGTAV